MARVYRVISADSHLEIPGDRWIHRVPERYRGLAPTRVALPGGGEAHFIEGAPLRVEAERHLQSADRRLEARGGTWESNDGGGPPEQRLREQDQDGVDAEVLFTGTTGGPNFWRSGIKDDEAYAEIVAAYNTWLAEEYCAVDPHRLIGVAVIPEMDARTAVAELERCARMGLKAVHLTAFPAGKMYPTPEDDFFWAAASDVDVALTLHVEFGGGAKGRYDGPLFEYDKRPEGPVKSSHSNPISRLITGYAYKGARDVIRLVYAGVFDRFPSLQVYCAETQVGWIPMWLQEADDAFERHFYWAEELYGMQRLQGLPSEYVKRHVMWGFMKDPYGVSQRHAVGVEQIMWESDFPHSPTDWPYSLKTIEKNFAGVPADERQLMLTGNAVRFFHLDGD